MYHTNLGPRAGSLVECLPSTYKARFDPQHCKNKRANKLPLLDLYCAHLSSPSISHSYSGDLVTPAYFIFNLKWYSLPMMSVLLMEMDFRHLAHTLALTRTQCVSYTSEQNSYSQVPCHKNETTQTETTTNSQSLTRLWSSFLLGSAIPILCNPIP